MPIKRKPSNTIQENVSANSLQSFALNNSDDAIKEKIKDTPIIPLNGVRRSYEFGRSHSGRNDIRRRIELYERSTEKVNRPLVRAASCEDNSKKFTAQGDSTLSTLKIHRNLSDTELPAIQPTSLSFLSSNAVSLPKVEEEKPSNSVPNQTILNDPSVPEWKKKIIIRRNSSNTHSTTKSSRSISFPTYPYPLEFKTPRSDTVIPSEVKHSAFEFWKAKDNK